MEWFLEDEIRAEDYWSTDDGIRNAHLRTATVAVAQGKAEIDTVGRTLQSAHLHSTRPPLHPAPLDEFTTPTFQDPLSITLGPTEQPCSSSIPYRLLQSLLPPNLLPNQDDDPAAAAKDLDYIGLSQGLTLDQESQLLATSQGCREWIRKEMIRREKEFTNLNQLTIMATTWNVNGRKPSIDLRDWLLPPRTPLKRAPDVFIIGLQEVQPLSGISAVTTDPAKGTHWKLAIEEALDSPTTYVTLAAHQLVGILLVVLVKSCHEPFVRDLMITDAGTGFLGSGGNKGGVACRFALYDKSISCVSCHFAAHETNVERRNQDFHQVVRKALFVRPPNVFPDPSPFAYLDYGQHTSRDDRSSSLNEPISVLDHDAVFWTGDLNYRIDLPVDHALQLIQLEEWAELMKHDQLQNAMFNGEVFQGFEEGDVKFAPTYKLERDSDQYAKDKEDGLVKRTPSWTDRVLWRDRVRTSPRSISDSKPNFTMPCGVTLRKYCRHEVLSSDHRPVSALFAMDFRIINIRTRNNVVRKLHEQLARRENALRPRLSASATAVDLGQVVFGSLVSSVKPIELRNDGRVTAFITIKVDEFPVWLSLDDSTSKPSCSLKPGEKTQIGFRAQVSSRTGISPALNQDPEKLQAKVRIIIQNVNELFVSVRGRYVPTCLGNTLQQLAARSCSFRAGNNDLTHHQLSTSVENGKDEIIDDANGQAVEKYGPLSSRERYYPIPKEVWILVDFMVRCGQVKVLEAVNALTLSSSDKGNDVSLQSSPFDNVAMVLQRLSARDRIPQETTPDVVMACLLELLQCLEEPVVPYANYKACVDVGAATVGSRDVKDVERALRGAPVVNVNTLKYISAFFGSLMGACDILNCDLLSTNAESEPVAVRLIAAFGPIILCPPSSFSGDLLAVESASKNCQNNSVHFLERCNFLRHMIFLSSTNVTILL